MPVKNVLLVVALFAVIFTLPRISPAQQGSKVVAVVNGSPLTAADLNQEILRILPENKTFHGQLPEEKIARIRAEAMQKLVESELQSQDAIARGMKLGEAELKAEIAKLSATFKTRKEFLAAVAESGFTEKEFSRFVERNVLSQRISTAEIDDRVKVTDATVKEYYDRNSSRYRKPQEYHASQILIKVDPAASPDERAGARARVEAILKKIRQGGDFADIAAAESEDMSRIKGGDIGYFHAGQTLPEFDEELAKMKVGDTSGIVESMYGFHIIRLTGKKEPRQIPFEELRAKIGTELTESEKRRLKDLWMSGLKTKAVITYPGEK